MAAGAIDVIAKPELGVKQFLADSATRIRDRRILPKLTADAVLAPPGGSGAMLRTTERIVATGASTGGTEALRELLEAMPRDCPPIVFVQHMPETVTPAFARRLDSLCAITVTEARNGDRLLRGHALIGPGNRHTLLTRSGAIYQVEARDGPLVSRHKPSVDVLFRSVARNAVGAILTGMGDDGARGLKEMRDKGAATLGQNEASCVVYGMPKEAMQRGAVAQEMPLERIPAAILRLAR